MQMISDGNVDMDTAVVDHPMQKSLFKKQATCANQELTMNTMDTA